MKSKQNHTERVLSVLRDEGSAAKSVVAASWLRSLTLFGLDPAKSRPAERLSESEFRVAYEHSELLVHLARETLDNLFRSVCETGCCIALTDHEGVLLDRRGNASDDVNFRGAGLWTGAVWSEAKQGTNAMGTSIVEGRPLSIIRGQHFMNGVTEMCCTAAPIRDAQGKIIASLDVSSARSDLTDMTFKLLGVATRDSAQRIETQLFQNTFSNARVVLAPDTDCGAGGLLAVDQNDLVIGANHKARKAYSLTEGRLGSPFPLTDILGSTAPDSDYLMDAERGALKRALARSNGNVSAAADLLGVSRATLHRKIARYGLGVSRTAHKD